MCSVQGMEEPVQGYELTMGVFAACAPKRPEILHGGRDSREAGFNIRAKRLADQFGARAVLRLADLLNLLHHLGRE